MQIKSNGKYIEVSIDDLVDTLILNNHFYDHPEVIKRFLLKPMEIEKDTEEYNYILKKIKEKLISEMNWLINNKDYDQEYIDKLYHMLVTQEFQFQERNFKIEILNKMKVPQYMFKQILEDLTVKKG